MGKNAGDGKTTADPMNVNREREERIVGAARLGLDLKALIAVLEIPCTENEHSERRPA
jgi:hypothetical protein